MKIIDAIKNAFSTLRDFITGTNAIATQYGPQIREFVVATAEDLEQWIPDHGFGNIKLMAFDGALKIFVDTLKEKDGATEDDAQGIWKLAHFFLDGYVASQKAKGAWKAAQP
jgi:hypothetical protein